MNQVTLAQLDALPDEAAAAILGRCCAEETWKTRMNACRPFGEASALFAAAETCFDALDAPAWRAAFAAHPRIGDLERLAAHDAASHFSRDEQSQVLEAAPATLQALADANRAYEKKFGFVFLICAQGRSAEELLSELVRRSEGSAEREMELAKEHLRRITRLRLEALVIVRSPRE